MAITVHVNGSDQSSRALLGSLRINWSLGSRATASITFRDDGAWKPTIGHSFEVKIGSTVIMGGVIDEWSQYDPTLTTTWIYYFEVLVVGWEIRLDKRVVNAQSYGREPVRANAISDVLTFEDTNPFSANAPVQIRTSGTLPSGLSSSTTYYVVNGTSTTCQLSASSGGSPINFTSDGTGDHWLIWCAGAAVKKLADFWGAFEDFSPGTIRPGAGVETLAFEWPKISEVIDALARLSGYVWYISGDRKLNFVPRTEFSAPFNVASPFGQNVLAEGLKVRHTNEEYGNSIHLRINENAFGSVLTTFTGDGSKRKFRLATIIKTVSSISRSSAAGVEQTIGILGVDSGKDWYYEEGGHWIYQDAGGTVPGAGESIFVSHKDYGFDARTADDTGEQSARAAVETGTSGVYDLVLSDDNILNTSAADTLAASLLSRYKQVPVELTFNSRTDGLLPGQVITVDLPLYSIFAESYLINDVSARQDRIVGGLLRYTVKAISTTRLGGALDTFRSFLGGGSAGGGTAVGGAGGGSGSASIYSEVVTLSASSTVVSSTATPMSGTALFLTIRQDATGGRQVTWSAQFDPLTPVDIPMGPNESKSFWFAGNSSNLWELPGAKLS